MRRPLAGAAVGVAIALAPAAHAADCNIDVVEFGSAMTSVRLSLESGYSSGAARVVQDMHDRIDCLRFPPPPQLWADWLFLVALTRFAQGRTDWDRPLERALLLSPSLDRRMVGKDHELRTWEPPEGPRAPSLALSYDRDDITIYVDGSRVANTLPDPDGLHLVQINNGAWWDSMLVNGGQAADGLWVPRRQPQPVRVRLLGYGVVGGLTADWDLTRDSDAQLGTPAHDQDWTWGVGLRGQVTVGRLAFRAQVAYDELGQVPLYWAVGIDEKGLGAGLGATAERVVTHRLLLGSAFSFRERWYPDFGLSLWFDPPGTGRHVDVWALVAPTRLALDAGLWPQKSRDPFARYRIGALATARRVFFDDTETEASYRGLDLFAGVEISFEVVREDYEPPPPFEEAR